MGVELEDCVIDEGTPERTPLVVGFLFLFQGLFLLEFVPKKKPYLSVVDSGNEMDSVTVELTSETVSDSQILSLCQQASSS